MKKIRPSHFVLLALVLVLLYLVWSRVNVRMGGAPAELATAFPSEEAWLVSEILLDVGEMSLAARGVPLDALDGIEVEPGADSAVWTLSLQLGSEGGLLNETFRLPAFVWDERAYAAMAVGLLEGRTARHREAGAGPASEGTVLERLLEPTDDVMAEEDRRISRELVARPTSGGPHEEAALLLAVLALREAAGTFTDARFTFGRVSAHLAMADALGTGGLGITGRLARALLLTLIGREGDAARELEALRDIQPSTTALDAWLRVIESRTTDDWRVLPASESSSLVERVERFRAMSRTMDTATAIERAGELDWEYEPMAVVRMFQSLFGGASRATSHTDWFHVAVDNYEGPSDGMYFRGDVMARERVAADTLRQRYGVDAWRLADALNAPGERFYGPSGPSVLGWSAWAAFYQRHLSDHLVKADTYYRRGLGLPEWADRYAARADAYFGRLRLHPFVRMRRTARPGVRVEDIDAMGDVVTLTAAHPDVISASNWYFAEFTTRQMALRRGMPHGRRWFSPHVAETTTFDSERRFHVLGWDRSPERVATARALAPSNRDLWMLELELPGRRPPTGPADLGDEMSRRLDYDLVSLSRLRNAAGGEESLSLSQRMCELEPSTCITLGYRLVRMGDDQGAAAAFQQAVDRAEDTVYVANNVEWLVLYYHREGDTTRAMEVARRAESTGAGGGFLTMGALLEAMGRFEEAETCFRRNHQRYDRAAPLIAFYFRRARVDGLAAWETKLEEAAANTFPHGLEPFDAESLETPPVDGVLVNSNSDSLRQAGLAPGDIIVALDGWRVRSWEQYETVRAFTRDEAMKLVFWRVNRLVDADVTMPFRRFYVDMITYEPRWSIDR